MKVFKVILCIVFFPIALVIAVLFDIGRGKIK